MAREISESQKKVRRIMETARRSLASFAEIDRGAGTKPPEECGCVALLCTAMSAIDAGLREHNSTAVAEGQAMLEILHRQLSGREYKPTAEYEKMNELADSLVKFHTQTQ